MSHVASHDGSGQPVIVADEELAVDSSPGIPVAPEESHGQPVRLTKHREWKSVRLEFEQVDKSDGYGYALDPKTQERFMIDHSLAQALRPGQHFFARVTKAHLVTHITPSGR